MNLYFILIEDFFINQNDSQPNACKIQLPSDEIRINTLFFSKFDQFTGLVSKIESSHIKTDS